MHRYNVRKGASRLRLDDTLRSRNMWPGNACYLFPQPVKAVIFVSGLIAPGVGDGLSEAVIGVAGQNRIAHRHRAIGGLNPGDPPGIVIRVAPHPVGAAAVYGWS